MNKEMIVNEIVKHLNKLDYNQKKSLRDALNNLILVDEKRRGIVNEENKL